MRQISRTVTAAAASFSFMFLSLSQGLSSDAPKTRESPSHPSPTASEEYPERGNVSDVLTGEWRVRCEVKTYQNGNLLNTFQENVESLVVIETDPDGSYQLYKFPGGFGEGFPRLRRVGANQYAGDDTVRGITTLVKQSVELQDTRVKIRQTVIDAPTRQPESETTCSGSRVSSSITIPEGRRADVCLPEHLLAQWPDKKLAKPYKSVKPFSDEMAAVAGIPRGNRSLKWGFIDKTGRLVIPMRYDEVTPFHGGLAAVGIYYGRGRNLKWTVVEKLGPQVTPHVNYDAVKILGEGFAALGYAVPGRPGLRWNLINRENTTVLYGLDDIGCFESGRARASYTDLHGVHNGYVNRVGDFFADKE